MTFFWVLLYNLIFYPLMYLIIVFWSLFNRKLKEGFKGRLQSIETLKTFFATVDRSKPVFWFHAASHGEYEQVHPVVAGLKDVEPYAIIVVSFFSPSGFKNVTDENIDCKIYLPFDFVWSVRKAIKIVKPKKIIFAAYDIWPNLIWVAKYRKIHTMIFAAHFTRGTKKLFPVLRSFYRSVYKTFSAIYTITNQDYLCVQKIIKSTQTPIIRVLGNPRYDRVKKRADKFTKQHTISVLLREKRIIVGSVWPEDEAVILDPILQLMKEDEDIHLMWVPHEPKDDYVQQSLAKFEEQGLSTQIMRSKKNFKGNGARVTIIGIVGVLSRLYWQGQIAYIGGGFSTGVHNVMEPAIARLPVIFGPRHANSHEASELISNGGGFPINNSDEVYQIIKDLFTDNNKFLQASYAATDVIHKNLGSSTRIVRSIIRD